MTAYPRFGAILSRILFAIGLLMSISIMTSATLRADELPNDTPTPSDDVPDVVESPPPSDSGGSRATEVTHVWGDNVWTAQGPGPSQNGQVENVTPDQEVVGAIHTVVAHPTDADTIYIGATNGGVWKTTNGTNVSPAWTPLIDQQGSLAIGALEFDPTDGTHETLVAGIGRYSSFSRLGGNRIGLLKTTDGGTNWTLLDGSGAMTGRNISGVAPRGNTILASVNVADSFTCSNVGLFRSTNGGTTFTQLNNATNGFPAGIAYDLASDSSNNAILYSSVVFADICNGASNGVYRSADTGATWTKVSSAAMDALLINSNTSNVEISVGGSGEVYVAIINTGNLAGLFRSPAVPTAASWTQLDTPSTNENGIDVGLNPRGSKGPPAGSPQADIAGGQGSIHFSLKAHPTNANLVYAGGDRQPRSFGDAGSFPNSIGAMDFTGRLFRGDVSQASGSQFVHLTHSNSQGATGGGTASSSAPHADSREIAFDANGNIIEVDDGGVYRRTSPTDNTGDWFSINGNLQVTEIHDIAYDSVSNRIVSGNQDTGTTYQLATDGTTWNSLTTADGGDVAIDDVTLAGSNQWILYSSFQNLGVFRRTIFNSDGSIASTAVPALTVQGGGAALGVQFVTPVVLNAIDPINLIIGASNGVYESADQGDTITQISSSQINAGTSGGHMMVYGGRSGGVDNSSLIYAAADNVVQLRTTAGGTLAATATAFPGSFIRGIDANPDDWNQAYAVDNSDNVYVTPDAGATTWTDVTGNLNDPELRSVETTNTVVFVGGSRGLYMMFHDEPGVWYQVGNDLPTVSVWDIEYDETDDVLVIGTLGRGAWKLSNVTSFLEAPDSVKRCGIAALQSYDFNSLDTLTADVTAAGDIDCLTMGRVATNHPNIDAATLETGQYWSITAENALDAAATAFAVNLTLPTNYTATGADEVCRYTGTGTTWDCATASSFTENSLTRQNVTAFSDWATRDLEPTAVGLDHFQATVDNQGNVTLDWETSYEVNHAGFNIYRRSVTTRDAWAQVNENLIGSHGSQAQGATYQFVDVTVSVGEWEYVLEDVETDGNTMRHDDMSATISVGAPTAVAVASNRSVALSDWAMLGQFAGLALITLGAVLRQPRDEEVSQMRR